MRQMPLFGLIVLLATGCSSSEKTLLLDETIIHETDHLGEYLQRIGPEEVVTVSRQEKGLVLINLEDHERQPLDPEAKEARDLIYRDNHLVYRIANKAFIIFNVSNRSKPQPLSITPKRILTFEWKKNEGRLSFETPMGECRWIRFDTKRNILAEGVLPGLSRASARHTDGSEWILINNQTGLFLGRWQEDEPIFNLVEPSHTGDFASLFEWQGDLYLTYLDRNTGVLKLVRRAQDTPHLEVEAVDGTPFKTYRGMDLAFFEDGDHPGFLYLDAWRLQLRMARFKNGKWVTKRVPISGATGFYTVVLNQTEEELKILTHSFRTDHEGGETTFENLVKARISLK